MNVIHGKNDKLSPIVVTMEEFAIFCQPLGLTKYGLKYEMKYLVYRNHLMILRIELWYSCLSLSVRVDFALIQSHFLRIQIKDCVFYYSKPFYYWQKISNQEHRSCTQCICIKIRN